MDDKERHTSGITQRFAAKQQRQAFKLGFFGVLEDIIARLGKYVDLFEITELKNNATMQSVVEREGIVLYDRQAVSQWHLAGAYSFRHTGVIEPFFYSL